VSKAPQLVLRASGFSVELGSCLWTRRKGGAQKCKLTQSALGPAMASHHHASSDRSTPAWGFLHWIPLYSPMDHFGHDHTSLCADSWELLQLHFKGARSKCCGLKAQTIISVMLVYTYAPLYMLLSSV